MKVPCSTAGAGTACVVVAERARPLLEAFLGPAGAEDLSLAEFVTHLLTHRHRAPNDAAHSPSRACGVVSRDGAGATAAEGTPCGPGSKCSAPAMATGAAVATAVLTPLTAEGRLVLCVALPVPDCATPDRPEWPLLMIPRNCDAVGDPEALQPWAKFYAPGAGPADLPPTIETVAAAPEHCLWLESSQAYLNIAVLRKRLALGLETLLLHADGVAAARRQRAYVHVPPLVPPAWLPRAPVRRAFLDACADVLTAVPLPHVVAVAVPGIVGAGRDCGPFRNGEGYTAANGNGVRLHFPRASEPLPDPDVKVLLVVGHACGPGTSVAPGPGESDCEAPAPLHASVLAVLDPATNSALRGDRVQFVAAVGPPSDIPAADGWSAATAVSDMTSLDVSAITLSAPFPDTVAPAPGPSGRARGVLPDLLKRSARFARNAGVLWPTADNRLKALAGAAVGTPGAVAELLAAAHSAYPLVHGKVRWLLREFLSLKAAFGSAAEKRVYRGMAPRQLLTRLLRRRPLVYDAPGDRYVLPQGAFGAGQCGGRISRGGFDKVGTDQERPPLTAVVVQTVDEVALSGLLCVSSLAHFINDGALDNRGARAAQGFERQAVLVAGVPPQLSRRGSADWQHCVVTPDQNVAAKGYGAAGRRGTDTLQLHMWARFYGSGRTADTALAVSGGTSQPVCFFPTYEDVAQAHEAADDAAEPHWLLLPGVADGYVNVAVLKERMRLLVEPFLVDASERALAAKRRAFVHAPSPQLLDACAPLPDKQAALMLEVYAAVFDAVSLPGIAKVCFVGFGNVPRRSRALVDGDRLTPANGNHIAISFGDRHVGTAVGGGLEDEGLEPLLLVALYPWSPNAYPGNGYWAAQLMEGLDTAVACASTIPELHNPGINPNVSGGRAYFTPDQGFNQSASSPAAVHSPELQMQFWTRQNAAVQGSFWAYTRTPHVSYGVDTDATRRRSLAFLQRVRKLPPPPLYQVMKKAGSPA